MAIAARTKRSSLAGEASHFTVDLRLGDCLIEMKSIQSVRLILCDLPYGTTPNKWDIPIPFEKLWEQYARICKGAVVLTASQPFTSALVMSNAKWFRYAWVWEKSSPTGHLNAKRMPMKLHEDVLVFSKDAPPYYPQGLKPFGKMVRRGHNGTNFGESGKENFQEFTNYPRSILRFANDPKPVHPTQKPVALMEYIIRTYTKEGDTVLDNCMGSGSTGVACVNTGRKFIGIESNAKYLAIAKDRIIAAVQICICKGFHQTGAVYRIEVTGICIYAPQDCLVRIDLNSEFRDSKLLSLALVFWWFANSKDRSA
jgi:site-specific DNA-methyltransferase (adenine-specific)